MKTKKIIPMTMILFMVLIIKPSISSASESNLIQNVQISLKETENPNRLEVIFYLTEPINLSQGSSNIIYEYFTEDSNGNPVIQYKKEKTWSGYLNSYDNYPSGEHKYSSGGAANSSYSDNVPAANIYTSTKTNSSIDVTNVTAVRVTVLREDGSGEKIIVYSDGNTSAIEKIVIPVGAEDKDTGIKVDSTTTELPVNTVLVANKLTSGSVYENVTVILSDVKDFIVYDIKLESEGVIIQPNGKVKISIPIPENFDTTNLAVYRIDNNGEKILYPVTIITNEGVNYAILETEHFSTYVLVDARTAAITETTPETTPAATTESTPAATDTTSDTTNTGTEKDETPKTGSTQLIYYVTALIIISAVGITIFRKKT